jgi:hypothetical protein
MSKPVKWTLWILGTILLGALGSGFWDLFLRNMFVGIGHGILTLITLGISSVRDSFYVEIAKGRTERAGLYLMSFTFIFLGFLAGLLAGRLARPISVGEAPGSDVSVARYRFFLRFTLFLLLLLTSIFGFRSLSITYTTGAIDHFEQSFAICLPFMSPHERDDVRSRFARIRTKSDYVAVLSTLEQKARQNSLEIPKFSVW